MFLFCNWVQHFRGNPASCLLTAALVSMLILVIYDVAPLRHDYILNVEIHSYELSLNLILCTTFSLFNHFNSLYMFVVNLSLSIKHSVGSVCVLAPRLQLSATALKSWPWHLNQMMSVLEVSSPFPNDTGTILQGDMAVCYFAQNSLSLFLCLHEVQWDFVVVCLIPGPLFESNGPDSLPRSKDFKTSLWSGRANHTPGQWSERHTLRRWHWCPVVGGMKCPMTDWWHVWVAWEQ